MGLLGRLSGFQAAVTNLGLAPAVFNKLQRLQHRLHARPERALFRFSSKRARCPLYCRPDTSDLNVFWQIFIAREYRCLDEVKQADLIIDCGANVGYSSAYFLSSYPKAMVVAVEPDGENFAMLERNLAPFKSRTRLVRSAVWSHAVGLKLSEDVFGDGREWARTVRPVRSGELPDMVATDIGTLLRESGHERISILKVDIEGAEKIVFAENCQEWLPRVDNLVIEIHGPECESVVRNAVAPEGFSISSCAELTVFTR